MKILDIRAISSIELYDESLLPTDFILKVDTVVSGGISSGGIKSKSNKGLAEGISEVEWNELINEGAGGAE